MTNEDMEGLEEALRTALNRRDVALENVDDPDKQIARVYRLGVAEAAYQIALRMTDKKDGLRFGKLVLEIVENLPQ